MPFKSKAQLKYFMKHHPEIAKEYLNKMTKRQVKALPDKLEKRPTKKSLAKEALQERLDSY